MKTMRVANVEEAVALANQLKQEGEYNWFRGQLREWTPQSSLERWLDKNPNEKPQLDAKLNRFFAWVKDQPQLAYLADPEQINALFAVLQHYGFPTSYIDFSTEPAVAGFFASDTAQPPEPPGNCVIYCLNTTELVDLYGDLNQVSGLEHLLVEPVVVDVPNLWRLQSQRGCFLYTNHAWYHHFDMDRIIFPWTGIPAFPSRERIYPVDKSSLEHLLDQYFFNERRLENQAFLRTMANVTHIDLDEFTTDTQDYFIAPPKPIEQWSSDQLQAWSNAPIEHFDSTVGRRMPVSLRSGDAAPTPAYQVQQSIKNALDWQPALRAEAVEWHFTGLPDNVDKQHFEASIRAAWNGMRNLPYTNEDIAAAMSALVTLCSLSDCYGNDGGNADEAFASWIPDAVRVELGNPGSVYSQAYCSDTHLLDALDAGWRANLQNPELVSIVTALCYMHDPRLMFDFKRLSWIFAREVIPSQLAMKRPVVLFNPTEMDSFGLA
ncbi:FRG domain-containing protein [Pseudomonas sp. dw_612]|uniref:FRG domain-containing protein n=1 Tax=Pseudomonas sp. dw_612 TaxID=2720080 RepID=UPI001BD4F5F0|nr:FRG domain-containing protein [Pseudomonas sp. dw_612]